MRVYCIHVSKSVYVCACVLDVRECMCVRMYWMCESVYVCACILHTCKRVCVLDV